MANVTPASTDPANFVNVVISQAQSTTIFSQVQDFRALTIASSDGSEEISIPATAYSLQGFRDWAASDAYPERGQITFSAEGLIIDMSPELLETHNYIKYDVGLTIHGLIRERKLGRFFGDRVLFSNETAKISTEPDAMFISHDTIRTGRCMLVKSSRPGINREVAGSPDWVMEVVSPTSVRKDKVILRHAYFVAGVREYWLIDALDDEIEFQILVPGNNEYIAVDPQHGWLASPTFGCSFRLTGEKDEGEFWQYTLHVQEKT